MPGVRPRGAAKQRAHALLLGAHVSMAGGIDRCPERGESLGCSVIQLFVTSSHQWRVRPFRTGEVEAFKDNLLESSIRVAFGHVSYLPNLASPDKALFARSVSSVLEQVKRCDRLGLPFLVIHPGSHTGAGQRRGLARTAGALNRIFKQTAGSKVKIALETTSGQGTGIGSRFEHLGAIIEGVKDPSRVGICFDTCHVFSAGYDISTPRGYGRVMDELDSVVGLERVLAFHLNDSLRPCGSKVDRHAHIGRGMIGRTLFRLLLRDPRFGGIPKVIETPKGPDARLDTENLGILRRMA